MEDTNQDGSEVLETTETEAEAVETTEEVEEESVEQLKARLAEEKKLREETEAKNKQLYERVKKQPKEEPAPTDQFSPKDYLALNQSGVSADDFDEVVRVSKILGKPVHEALKDPTLKTILDTRVEERRTAAASHTKGGARGAMKPSAIDILSKAEKTGDVPETEEGMIAMQEARLARKKNRGS